MSPSPANQNHMDVQPITYKEPTYVTVSIARGFGSLVKHLTADPGIASSIPFTPTKITKRRYVLVLSRKNAPVYQCFTLGT